MLMRLDLVARALRNQPPEDAIGDGHPHVFHGRPSGLRPPATPVLPNRAIGPVWSGFGQNGSPNRHPTSRLKWTTPSSILSRMTASRSRNGAIANMAASG